MAQGGCGVAITQSFQNRLEKQLSAILQVWVILPGGLDNLFTSFLNWFSEILWGKKQNKTPTNPQFRYKTWKIRTWEYTMYLLFYFSIYYLLDVVQPLLWSTLIPKAALVKTVWKTPIKTSLSSLSDWFHQIPVSGRGCAPQIPSAELESSTLALISVLKPWNCWLGVVLCSLYQRNMGHKLLPLALGRWWCLCSQSPACYWSLLYK